MKKLLILAISFILALTSCAAKQEERPETADEVADFLLKRNAEFIEADDAFGDISDDVRLDTFNNGQRPYAVVITCSDSRVPAELIFGAGIGELFVIRTAGNVIGEYELGSVEYGAEHLGAKLVLVLGHTNCGAVDAALSGGAHGHIASITDEISSIIPEGCDAREAEILNVKNSIARINSSEMIAELTATHGVEVRGAIYDIESGEVSFLDN